MGINEIFGNNVRKIRTEKKFSQEELASMAGIDRTYMSDIENNYCNGKIKPRFLQMGRKYN